MKIQIKENVYFAYHRDIEYFATLAGMLGDHLDGRLCREIYGEEFINKIRRKHRELVEIINSLPLGGLGILEFYMDYNGEALKLNEYRKHLEEMDTPQFIYQFFGYPGSLEEIAAALEDEELLTQFMDEGKLQISSYIILKRMINHRKEFLDCFFECIEEIRTPELEEYLDQREKRLPILQNEIEERLAEKAPIDVVRDIANKCVMTTKEYESYGFIPVFMLPRNAVTYYASSQFTLYSKKQMESREKALDILKIVADATRLRIIDLLSEAGQANGKKISRWLQLAPSTVSHHMEQLVDCGIVKEEKKGNSKVYSIDRDTGDYFIKEIETVILKNTDYR